MRIATDPALIGFDERSGDVPRQLGCSCLACVSQASLRRARPAVRVSRRSQLNRTLRGTCLATTVLAGAGAIGLSAGAGTANAEAAPSHAGWDGSRYWFRNESGAWRWTVHYDTYVSRTSGRQPAQPAPSGSDGMQQGWDGSRYWFRNESGEWRWTVHYDTYVSRTTGGQPAQQPAPSGSDGMQQGFDGSKYWFQNESGEWRYTSYYGVYVSRTSGRPAPQETAPPDEEQEGSYQAAIDYALAQVGKPYVWGGNGPYGFDCSGLVQQAYRRAGVELPRVADDQYAATTPITVLQLQRGDLIFWSDTSRASGIHHVAIYLGDGTYVEAPRPGKKVRISTLNSGYYPTHMGRP